MPHKNIRECRRSLRKVEHISQCSIGNMSSMEAKFEVRPHHLMNGVACDGSQKPAMSMLKVE